MAGTAPAAGAPAGGVSLFLALKRRLVAVFTICFGVRPSMFTPSSSPDLIISADRFSYHESGLVVSLSEADDALEEVDLTEELEAKGCTARG